MREKNVKIAVYGSLKRGFGNHRLIAAALISCKPCRITGRLYDTGCGYPAFIVDPDGYTVQAELMTLNARILAAVDRLEGHPNFYKRTLLECVTDAGQIEKAFVYVMPKTAVFYMKEITSGIWTAERA